MRSAGIGDPMTVMATHTGYRHLRVHRAGHENRHELLGGEEVGVVERREVRKLSCRERVNHFAVVSSVKRHNDNKVQSFCIN